MIQKINFEGNKNNLITQIQANNNRIIRVHSNADLITGYIEYEDDPVEVARMEKRDVQRELNRIDAEAFQIVDELINMLITRDVISISDFSQEAQSVVAQRQEYRDKLKAK